MCKTKKHLWTTDSYFLQEKEIIIHSDKVGCVGSMFESVCLFVCPEQNFKKRMIRSGQTLLKTLPTVLPKGQLCRHCFYAGTDFSVFVAQGRHIAYQSR